jgi:adenosylcobyric acid synthase
MTALMFMGTGSDVGKSLIVAGLCRLLSNRGIRVAPFKPQNMSNNAAVTSDGGEIGRAQALQARAARVLPSIHMNPILLKPEGETGAQVIVQGQRHSTMKARDFFANRAQFMPAILHSFEKLKDRNDIILCEGAGSPAEVNLRDGDLANMGFAKAANVPVLLIGDIHRGGVIASLIGTWAVLAPEDRAMLKGFIVNKFYGDPALFSDGMKYIETETGAPCLGIVPHFADALKLPAEDSVALEDFQITHSPGKKICVLRLPRIANFDDLDPLRMEPDVNLQFVQSGSAIPGDAALVIIPGSKSTITDLEALRKNGWDIDLKAHVRRGGRVLGICGGYQMLGRSIHDPQGLEGLPTSVNGLALLDVETTLLPDKKVSKTTATHTASQKTISAFEIHLGETTGADTVRPFASTSARPDGASSTDGLVEGTYLHGCFTSDEFRRSYLRKLGVSGSSLSYEATIDKTLDGLANHIAVHLDINRILDLAR